MEIVRARYEHVAEVARLFDLYRQFYQCAPDLALASDFIEQRIVNDESAIFVALEGDTARGFVQMYPSFCSVDAIRIQILYDLYVDDSCRNGGVGEALMNRAADYAREMGASRIDLLTAFDNTQARRLYEKIGYRLANEDFHAYSLNL